MFDRFFNFLISIWTILIPITVVDAYQRAIVLRLGKYCRSLGPGLHWIIPFGVEKVIKDSVVPRTISLEPQSLMTKDNKQIVIQMVFTVEIRNIKDSLLNIEHADDAIRDICYGTVGDMIADWDWEDLLALDFSSALVEKCNERTEWYGLCILNSSIATLSQMKSIRLVQ